MRVLGQVPKKLVSRPARAGKDRIITDPIGYETGWTIARSLGEVGTTSVHSNPVFACNDCTFLDELHRATLEKKIGASDYRKAVITLLGGAALAWPLAAWAQQRERMRRVGVLTPFPADDAVFQKKAARCEAAQLPIQGGMPDERATVTRERYRNANVIAGCIRPCVKYFTHGWSHVGVGQFAHRKPQQ